MLYLKLLNSEPELLTFGTTCLFSLKKTNSKSPKMLFKHLQFQWLQSTKWHAAHKLRIFSVYWGTCTYHERLLYCSVPLLLFNCSSAVWTHPQWKMQHIVCFWRCGKCCFARIFYSALWKRSIFSFTSTKKTMLASCVWCSLAQAKGKWCLQTNVLIDKWLFTEYIILRFEANNKTPKNNTYILLVVIKWWILGESPNQTQQSQYPWGKQFWLLIHTHLERNIFKEHGLPSFPLKYFRLDVTIH